MKEEEMGQAVVHFEVVGKDGARLQRYYSEMFGWTMNADNPMNYALVEAEEGSQGKGVPGGIGQGPEGYAGHVTFYVEVPDVEASLAQAESLGGTRVMGPETIMDDLTLGQFRDPEGNLIGLTQGS
jgi:predicted enzyme related to lactoylglutathione lyase